MSDHHRLTGYGETNGLTLTPPTLNSCLKRVAWIAILAFSWEQGGVANPGVVESQQQNYTIVQTVWYLDLTLAPQAKSLGDDEAENLDVEWRERLQDWRRRYQEKRRSLLEASGLDAKLEIMLEIYGPMVDEEIQKIEAIEQAEEEERGPSPYPEVRPRSRSWYEEIGEMTSEPLWDEEVVDRYYYHGTSLGIALVSGVRGELWGIPGVSKVLEIDVELDEDMKGTEVEDRVYFDDPSMYREENWSTLDRVIGGTVEYANRQIRPARAVLAYYAFRGAWEAEGRQERFPPFRYFLQRAILRFPKSDALDVSGAALLSDLGSDKPVPLQRGDILLDEDIPLPPRALIDGSNLAFGDPEWIDGKGLSPEDEQRLRHLVPVTLDRISAAIGTRIGNVVMEKWRPLKGLLPLATDSSAGVYAHKRLLHEL